MKLNLVFLALIGGFFQTSFGMMNEIEQIHERFNSLSRDSHFTVYSENMIARTDIVREARTRSDYFHEVIFAMKQRNLDVMRNFVDDVSNPQSVNYGKYKTRSEISQLTKPSMESIEFLKLSLLSHGASIKFQTPDGEYVRVKATIATWEKFFNTKFYTHSFSNNVNQKFVRSEGYSLPHYLADHVHAVFGTVDFPDNSLEKDVIVTHPFEGTSPSLHTNTGPIYSGYVSPALLNQFYKITSNTGSLSSTQAVYETIGQMMSPADLTTFQTDFSLPRQSIARDVHGMVNDNACATNYGNDCAEANLDVQYMMAVAQKSPLTYWYDNSTTFTFFVGWAMEVVASVNPPLVMSMSYSSNEYGYYYQTYYDAFDTEALKLCAMGVTIFAASGDSGANARGISSTTSCGYLPQFPATSPYVTAVGATMGPESGKTEVACQGDTGGTITTGGGFSTAFSTPTWQSDVVNSYFTQNTPVSGYNRQGRGYPDVSLLGANYIVIMGGQMYVLCGTSASTPAFAAMVTLVNGMRLDAGLSSLGWLNPALYQYSSQYINDITSGNNKCTENGNVCCTQGFNAASGWDPVTGLGSVDFTKFANTFKSIGASTTPTASPTPATTGPPPTTQPTFKSTTKPTIKSTTRPTFKSTAQPTIKSTTQPTTQPTFKSTTLPTIKSTTQPTTQPTVKATIKPTTQPTVKATTQPTTQPTVKATAMPTVKQTLKPTLKHVLSEKELSAVKTASVTSEASSTLTGSTHNNLSLNTTSFWVIAGVIGLTLVALLGLFLSRYLNRKTQSNEVMSGVEMSTSTA